MKFKILLTAAVVLLVAKAQADYSEDLIRISCIASEGFLDIEYRAIHDSTSADTATLEKRSKEFEINGFFLPKNLNYKCVLPSAEYRIVSTRAEMRERGQCSLAPDIMFSLFRNQEKIVDSTVFGESCFGNPSIYRITIQDPASDDGETNFESEAEVCLNDGEYSSAQKCQDYLSDFYWKRAGFPANQNAIEMKFSEPAANHSLKADVPDGPPP